ncbi:MAG: hypothetical protein CSA81_00775 [Acidobacteria bacterium]|nr:MAG: hypothetical protein CSA81_00775 [Acidobacteriota bacterium]
MALFFFKSKSKSADGVINHPDEVLAYLDEVIKKKLGLMISTTIRNVDGQIFFLEEKQGLMRVQGEGIGSLKKGTSVTCGFPLDRSWFSFTSKVQIKDNKTFLFIPEEIKHDERRRHARTAFSAREQVKITVLEGLGKGNGVFGHAIDLSCEGLCLSIDKAMRLEHEKEIPASPSLFKRGTELMLVKVNRIPGCAPFECQGKVVRLCKDGKWKLVIQLKKVPSVVQAQIENFVNSRTIPFKLVQRSRKKCSDENKLNRGFPVSNKTADSNGAAVPVVEAKGDSVVHHEMAAANELPEQSNIQETQDQQPVEMKQERALTCASANKKPTVITLGKELIPFLLFLKKRTNWYPEDRFEGLVKKLNEVKPEALIFSTSVAGAETFTLMSKIRETGLLENVTVILAHSEPLSSKLQIKLRMMGIDRTLKIPVEDKCKLLEILDP